MHPPIEIDDSIRPESHKPVRRAVERITEESEGKYTGCWVLSEPGGPHWWFHFYSPQGPVKTIRIHPDRTTDEEWIKKEVEERLRPVMD